MFSESRNQIKRVGIAKDPVASLGSTRWQVVARRIVQRIRELVPFGVVIGSG
jgi:hypothetical protein